ncbi:MAG: response regulator [Thermoleophilia bacterium]
MSTGESRTILVIDDEDIVRSLVVEILMVTGYEAVAAETPQRALELLADESIGLVISDIVMPGLTGFELLEEVRSRRPSLPVLLITGAGTEDNLSEALARGAAGLIAKPFSHQELRDAVAAVLDRAAASEREVREKALAPTLTSALANAIEARDSGTGGHTERLAVLAVRMGLALGLPRTQLETIRLGAILHDIGKIGIPDRVLLKPGPLDPDERELMRSHTVIGDRLLEPLDALAPARGVVRHHHERWDGGEGGYPDGLAGEEIPLAARIVAVADAVEAMSAKRPYRDPLDREAILGELERGRGAQWDPSIVDLMLALLASGEIRVDEQGLHLTDVGGGSDPFEELESQLLPDFFSRLADLNQVLASQAISLDELRAWYAGSAEDSAARRRLEALTALDALTESLQRANSPQGA